MIPNQFETGTQQFSSGKRAVFIRPMNGYNMGKIVELRYRFDAMDRAAVGMYVEHNNLYWLKNDKCHRTWIVEAVGEPLMYIKSGELTAFTVGPVPEYYLAPLDDFEEDSDLWISSDASVTMDRELREKLFTSTV